MITSPITINGQTLYKVNIQRIEEIVVWVLADNAVEAEEAGMELEYDIPSGGSDIDIDAKATAVPPEDWEEVWVGGPTGYFAQWEEVKELDA